MTRETTSPMLLPGGDLEYAVMVALCESGGGTAREVYTRVSQHRDLAYTTIATVLERLRAKRLAHRKRVGRAFRYLPAVKRRVLERARAEDLLKRLLGPGPEPAVAMLVDVVEAMDPALLDEMARAVEARRNSRAKS